MPSAATTKKVLTLGLGQERDNFTDNIGLLLAAGMPIVPALDAIASELRPGRMKHILANMRDDIINGSPAWRAFQATNLFADHSISLIRLGEESGRLVANLKLVAIEQGKDRVFRSKLRSATIYPVFVLLLMIIIGIGIAWFILPKLALVFSQLHVKLPLITRTLIAAGVFLGRHGQTAVPLALVTIAGLVWFVFLFSRTKFIGQAILFSIPGMHQLMKEVELARFGFLLGTLLQAGLPITQALDSLAGATGLGSYKKLYQHLRQAVEDGNSLQKSFASWPNSDQLIPAPVQQLIVAGEQSGQLPETLLKVGQIFEVKSDTTAKNLAVMLEPVLLVIVWLGVVTLALAVILPIYSLIGGLNSPTP